MDETRHQGTKDARMRSIAFVLPKALDCIHNAGLTAPREKNVRDLLHRLDGAETEYKSTFLDQPRKISCVRIPWDVLSQDTLDQIDQRKFDINFNILCIA
jgi:hypothetical protein